MSIVGFSSLPPTQQSDAGKAAPRIVASSLSKVFDSPGGPVPAFLQLEFQVADGEFVCVLGPSGCGKTTLLRAVAGLETPSEGSLQVTPPAGQRHSTVGMVFQGSGLFPWKTVAGNLRFVLKNNPRIPRREIPAIVENHLQRVGLWPFRDYYPQRLSGGMRQRVSLARCFANRSDLLLMDEPFVFLDFQTRVVLQELLLEIWGENRSSVLFVTHDIEEAVLLADRILVMSARPGKLKAELDVPFERPRRYFELRRNAAYQALVDQVADLIRHEMPAASGAAKAGP